MTKPSRAQLLTLGGILVLLGGLVGVADSVGIINGTTFAEPSLSPAIEQTVVAEPLELSGTWVLVPDGSYVGYRVFEPARDAEITGRTNQVAGSLVVGDTTPLGLTGLTVTADLRSLESDAAARDSAIRGRLLESERYPAARFVADDGLVLPDMTTGADLVDLEVPGTLTIRGTDRPATLTAQVRVTTDRIDVVGQAPIVLSDFGIDRPPGAVLSDAGIIEFAAEFAREDRP